MRVLLDECVHRKVAKSLSGHSVVTVQEAGWGGVKNGELLRRAAKIFDVFVSSDKNLRHQHRLSSLPLPILVIETKGNMWEDIEPIISAIQNLLRGVLNREFYSVK